MKLRRTTRLPGFNYIGRYAYLLTICCARRNCAFDDHEFARQSIARLLRTANKFGFALIAYCLMPDHVHLLPRGEGDDSDLEAFVKSWNTQTGYYWKHRTGGTLWQAGYHDTILWSEFSQHFAAQYVLMNPVRAGLVKDPGQYPFSGSSKYTIAELMDDGYLPIADKPKGLSPQEILCRHKKFLSPQEIKR